MQLGAAQTLYPLTDFVDRADLVLTEFVEGASDVLDAIMVADAWSELRPDGFTLGANFHLGDIGRLSLPGLDQFALSIDDVEPTRGILVCGPDPSLTLSDVGILLHVDPSVLSAADGTEAIIRTSCGIRFDRDGFQFLSFTDASLIDARIAGTDMLITLQGIALDPDGDDLMKVAKGSLTLPQFKSDKNDPLVLETEDLAFGRDGVSGRFHIAAGSALPVTIYDFKCELERAGVELRRGQLISFDLGGRLNLSKFLSAGRSDGWVQVDFSIGVRGVVAALSDDEPIVSMFIRDMFALSVDAIRLESGGNEVKGGTLWLSGELTPDLPDVEGGWPSFAFDEIGIGANGDLRWGEGASIATPQPFVVSWNFLRLTVTAFGLARPKEARDDLELRISAGVEILQGLPAGASVEGLVARRVSGGEVKVRFDGIGLSFGTPGAFAASVKLAWDSGRRALTGAGYLDIQSIDVRMDVIFEAAQEKIDGAGVTSLFLASESDLLPGGIPIGSTGLSLYAVSGLLAYNKAIKLQSDGPRRYFEAYKQGRPGFADLNKWKTSKDSHALGLGVVIGTADDGWMFSARGALLLTIPDFILLITATAELLHERTPMSDPSEGVLSGVVMVHPADQLVRLDFAAQWHSDQLFDVGGEGGGEFYFNKPFDWSVWLGLPSSSGHPSLPGKPPRPGQLPLVGQPVHAHAIKVDKWLIDGDFYFRIDAARSAEIGLHSRLELRTGTESVFAELVGEIYGDAQFSWSPLQFEGSFGIDARGRLAAGGLTLGLSLSSDTKISINRPRLIEIALAACIELGPSWSPLELCLKHVFDWRDEEAPKLDNLFQGATAVPRHWVPRPHPTKTADDGRVNFVSSGIVEIHPHSEIVLEFGKAMFIDIDNGAGAPNVDFNEPGKPFMETIGRESGWQQKWTLTGLQLIDHTEGKAVELFGTFQQSPLAREESGKQKTPRLPNSHLRLLSSRRFGEDGSLGGGGVERVPAPDCGPHETLDQACTPLAGLDPGFGRLSNGWRYQWRHFGERLLDNEYGVGLDGDDSFQVYVPEEIDQLEVTYAPYKPGEPPMNVWTNTTVNVQRPGPTSLGERGQMVIKLCWKVFRADDRTNRPAGREGSSGKEEWGRDADKWLLRPQSEYELVVATRGDVVLGSQEHGAPVVAERRYRFKTMRAPDWPLALARAVAGVYPADGLRPAYRDYDLMVHFKEPYLEALYRLDARILGVRLRDANGLTITDSAGREVLIPSSWTQGPVERNPAESWWEKARGGRQVSACEGGFPPPAEDKTVLPVSLKDLDLAPLTCYTAELVAVDKGSPDTNPTPPLHVWSFTTSRFRNFAELAAAPAPIPALGLSQLRATLTKDFDGLIRTFDAPVVEAVDRVRITPVRDRDTLAFLLMEAPEPLDDESGRLVVTVDSKPAPLLHPNLDRTRIIAELAEPIVLTEPDATVSVVLEWHGDVETPIESRRAIAGKPVVERCAWQVPLRGLFR